MSTLPQFERALVEASRALHAEASRVRDADATVAPSRASVARAPRRRRLIQRVRQLNVALQFGLAVSTISALAGGGAFAYLALSSSSTRTLASFECSQTPKSAAIIDTITGDPLVDCAVAWPSASGGRSAAPPLVAWALSNGTMAAVVRPARWPAPPASGGEAWHRLRPGWTVNLGVVAITDQLNDLASGLSSVPSAPAGGTACSAIGQDAHTVRSLLAADGLGAWRVLVRGPHAAVGCQAINPIIAGSAQTVTLIAAGPGPGHATGPVSPALRATIATDARLLALDRRINHTLSQRCLSVTGAAALWAREAGRAGLRVANLAYYRALNASTPAPARLANGYYTLVRQPASQRTGTCAHILVMSAGGGATTVYAARLAAPAGLRG